MRTWWRRRRRPARPRVAILSNLLLDRATGQPHVGGAERYARELGVLLRDLGMDPTFYQRDGEWDEGDFFGFPVIPLPRGEHFSEFDHGVGAEFFERTRDVDHVLYLMPNFASGPMREDAILVCHGVWWDHDLYPHLAFRTEEWYRHLERAFSQPRCVVSVDTNSINVVRALFPSAALRMRLIPSWVDTDLFHPPASRRRTEPRIIFPRRIDPVRGPQLVGPILERVPEPCRAVWVGEGNPQLLAGLQRVATDDPRFSVTDAPFDEMPGIYREADIVVIPTVGSEGQSLACLEAMASGCAVVATRVGGLPELIRDGVDGLLCDPTPESIAAAVRTLVRDPDLRSRLGREGRAAAVRHSLAVWRSQWTELLRDQGWLAADPPSRSTEAGPVDRHHADAGGSRSPTVAAGDALGDIVCFSIVNWEHRSGRPKQMMTTWAGRGRRVFYLRVNDYLEPGEGPIEVRPLAENVWEVRLALPVPLHLNSGLHPEGFTAAGLDALRTLRVTHGITRALAVVHAPGWTPLAVAARAAFDWPIVYDCMDDWKNFPGFSSRPAVQLEEELVTAADQMVVSSGTLLDSWRSQRPDVLLAPNAVDQEFVRVQRRADPLPDVTGPVAGFIGGMAEWFDVELVALAAARLPHVTFVLVGGVHRISVAALEELPNVRLVGQQPYEAMPDYLSRFDVCLVPFRRSLATDAMDVMKLYQYLSFGHPVVATRIRAIADRDEFVYFADDHDDFVRLLVEALAEDDPARRAARIDWASRNTWDERLDRIEPAIVSALHQERPAMTLTGDQQSALPDTARAGDRS